MGLEFIKLKILKVKVNTRSSWKIRMFELLDGVNGQRHAPISSGNYFEINGNTVLLLFDEYVIS